MGVNIKSTGNRGLFARAAVVVVALAAMVLGASRLSGRNVPTTQPTNGAASHPATQAASQPAPLTVATYNINYGNADLDKVVEVIRSLKADLVCLQETNAEGERHLRASLKDDFPHMSFAAKEGGGGFGLLSRRSLGDVKYYPPKAGWFGFYECVIEWAGRKVRIVNVHLQPVLPENGEGLAGLFKLMLQTERVRAAQCEHLLSLWKDGEPVVMLGDYNSLTSLSGPAKLVGRGLTDSLAAVTENPDANITWQWLYQGIRWRYRIDHIFHSKHVRTADCRVVPDGPSDHYPVVSTLEWRLTTTQPATQPATAEAAQAGVAGGTGVSGGPGVSSASSEGAAAKLH